MTRRIVLIVLGCVIGLAMLGGLGAGAYWLGAQQRPKADSATADAGKGKATAAEPTSPVVNLAGRLDVVHTVAQSVPPAPLSITDREPAKVRVEAAYQFEPPAGEGYRPRFVPYPGAPYVAPVRPYDPNEPRYDRIEIAMEVESGVYLPVVKEQLVTATGPVVIRRKSTDQPPPATSSPPPASPPATTSGVSTLSEPAPTTPAPAGPATSPSPPPADVANKDEPPVLSK